MSIILNKILELLFPLVLILLALLLFEVTDVHAQAGNLPPDEVRALRDIAKEVGKRDWNFSLNPCGNNSNWVTPNPTETYNNTVECNCSYPRGVCHVIKIFLKGQDLDGVLPPSLAKLPYIKTIDLTRNYLNGTIPPEWATTNLEYLRTKQRDEANGTRTKPAGMKHKTRLRGWWKDVSVSPLLDLSPMPVPKKPSTTNLNLGIGSLFPR